MTLLRYTYALLLAGSLIQAQQPAPATPPDSSSTPVYGPTHVEAPDLHLAFDLPDGVLSRKDLADAASRKFEKKSPTGELCTSLPVLAYDPKVIRRIYFYRYNGACFSAGVTQEQLRSTVRRALTAILHASGRENMSSPIDYKLGEHSASVISGNVYAEANHGILFGEMTCAAIESDIACWAFISSTPPKTARLAAIPIQFDGRSPEPIIPEEMSQFVALPTLTFHDDKRRVEFTYPGTFANAKPRADALLSKKSEEASGATKVALNCMNILLNADELMDDQHSNLFIFGFNPGCLHPGASKATLHDLALGLSKGYVKNAKAKMHEPVPYTIAEHNAVLIQGVISPSDKPASQISTTCTTIGTEFICLQLSSTSAEHLASLLYSPLAFEGGIGVSLVPPAISKLPALQKK